MKFWNWLRKEKTGERILRLDGAISDETWLGDTVTPEEFRAELNSGGGDIEVWINSPGGDVFAATEIYNALKEYRGKVTVKIDSIAGSAASMVAMSGDVVEISPTGMMMIHNPETGAIGNTDEFTAAIKFLEQIKEGLITAYALKTKLPRAEISKLMDAETWLNARKAVELGFADKIMYSEEKAVQTPAQIFSQRKVTNSLAKAFRARIVEDTQTLRRVATARLSRRLDEIEEYKPEEWGKDTNEICAAMGLSEINIDANQQQKFGLRRGKKHAQISRTANCVSRPHR